MSKAGFSKAEDKLRSENKTLGVENNQLKDSNIRLREDVRSLKQQNAQLSEVCVCVFVCVCVCVESLTRFFP